LSHPLSGFKIVGSNEKLLGQRVANACQLSHELFPREIAYDHLILVSEKTVCIPEIHHMIMPKKKGSLSAQQ